MVGINGEGATINKERQKQWVQMDQAYWYEFQMRNKIIFVAVEIQTI